MVYSLVQNLSLMATKEKVQSGALKRHLIDLWQTLTAVIALVAIKIFPISSCLVFIRKTILTLIWVNAHLDYKQDCGMITPRLWVELLVLVSTPQLIYFLISLLSMRDMVLLPRCLHSFISIPKGLIMNMYTSMSWQMKAFQRPTAYYFLRRKQSKRKTSRFESRRILSEKWA